MSKYQGRTVTVVRPAAAADPGYDKNKGDQVVIKDASGPTGNADKVVTRAEVTE